MKIVAYFDRPLSNPDRSIDWSAWDGDKDGCEPGGLFRQQPIGWGETEQAAIADLLQQIEDRS
jgi:hypothetical protein